MLKQLNFKNLLASIMLGVFAAISTPAMATNEAMLDLLEILVKKGSITEGEYELLVNASKADGEKVEGNINEMKAKVAKTTKKMPKITTKGKFKVASQDGTWEWQPIGRIFWDTMYVDNDGGTLEDNGEELRRARLGFQGKVKPMSYKLELDFANSGTPSWKDVWLAYNGKTDAGKWWLKVGQHHVPFGHATISSSKYMTMMRRPLFADGPQLSRNVGIAGRFQSKAKNRWFAHAGVFVPGLSTASDETGQAATDRRTTAFRVGGTPYYKDKNHLLHVGFSYQHEEHKGDAFSNIDNTLLTHIGNGDSLEANFGTNADDSDAFDIEAITVMGSFHGIFEYVTWDVSDPTGGDVDLSAWAIDAGYFFTGESMKYKYGAWSGIKPKKPLGKGGLGAWQITARYENMDLSDMDNTGGGNTSTADDGGEADVFTIGLNWYPTSNTRIMADYSKVLDFSHVDLAGTANDAVEPAAFQMRAQVYW